MNAGLATETVGARTKVRERHPPSERGVRVRVYPNAEQVPALVARGRARAQANEEDTQGLAIKCTRAALSDEVKRVRRDPAYRWLRDPTVTVPGRAEATTKPACASSGEDNGGADAPSSAPAGAGTPRDGPAAGGLDGGAGRGHEERSI